jgi:phage terminase large subunit GpA-like protein
MSRQKKQIELPLSDFVENFFHLKGQRFSLEDYPHMRTIYNCDADKITMKFSRQTAKSTSLANILLARAYTNPQLRQLYVSPAVAQTQEFARDKLEPLINTSPISKNFVDSHQVQNVFKKEFKNGSVINLRYALLNADRIRGISADVNLFDECQDLKKDVIGVIEETMSRSEIKKSIYVGTPKRTKGTLADYWFKSTQNEYAVKSSASGH